MSENKMNKPANGGEEKNITDSVLAKVNKFEELGQIQLPKDFSPGNAIKSAWLILQETEDKDHNKALSVCTKESIANALLNMCLDGLSPAKSQGYFIVYGKKLLWQRSYMGNLAKAKKAGITKAVAVAIYPNDEFEFEVDPMTGLKRILRHKQSLDTLDNQNIKGAYAILTHEDGTQYIEIMNKKQIMASWQQGANKGNSPAHKNFSDEMAKKTVMNRACKLFVNTTDDSGLNEVVEEQSINQFDTYEEVKEEIEHSANKAVIDFEAEKQKAKAESNPTPNNKGNKTADGPGF